MSHLSLLHVGRSEAARLRLADAYAWHKRLWEAFPGRPEDTRDFLFRVEDHHDAFRVYLLSPGPPQVPAWGRWEKPKTVAPTFLEHERYRFALRANPTLRRSSDGRRLGITDEIKLRTWLDRKAADGGFAVLPDALTVGAPIDETFVRDGRRGKHLAVEFDGLLVVRDRERFRAAYHHGIGSAKAFGFGLLLLAPIA